MGVSRDRNTKGGANAGKRWGRSTSRGETGEKLEGDGEEDAGASGGLRATEDIGWGEGGSMFKHGIAVHKRTSFLDGRNISSARF